MRKCRHDPQDAELDADRQQRIWDMYTADVSSTSSREDRRGPRGAEVDSGIVVTQ